MARDGWLSLPFQEAYGGGGASYKDMAVFIEALGYHHAGITSAYMTTVVYGGMQVQSHADEELKRQMLARIMKGELRMAISYTEPSSGSDAAANRTRAVRQGDDYTAEMLDAGEDPILETAMAKTIATEHSIRVADLAFRSWAG